ncbi:MAG: SDR family oxidoreductase [Planctomycetota bacterium]|nr:SDR family oxidoreductase [Planctomycetota bacterium]
MSNADGSKAGNPIHFAALHSQASTQAKHEKPVALVTGAGSGIGQATAVSLGARGYRLVLVGRRADRLQATLAKLPTPCSHLVLASDLASGDNAARMIDATVERFGRLDALVNNAGYAPWASLENKTPEMVRQIFEVNAIAAAMAIARAWPALRAAACSTGRATIVNLSSYATKDPFPGLIIYAASKAALNMLARACHNEGRSLGIRAFAIAPGAVETEMLRSILPESAIPSDQTLQPEAIADLIGECVSGARDAESGQTIFVPSPSAAGRPELSGLKRD